MRWVKLLFVLLITLVLSIMGYCYRAILFIVDIIDGGDDVDDSAPTDQNIWYNYRTGELDPVKRIDGLYEEKP
ncbi:MAG: hypothetical protein P1U80_13130 [Pseudomonadales bacterium]|jgi:hypothetical protein|nr:hypothetical protein [Pseudomonadales bacterium]